jgi:peptidoglycan/LPS O-acetylase OafA/YrhL
MLPGGQVTGALSRTVGYLISSVAAAHLVLWLICFRDSRATALLRTAPIQHVGKIAYGVYLTHVPVSSYLGAVLHTRAFNDGWQHVVSVYAVTLVCASLSWRFLESPLIELGRQLTSRGRVSFGEPVGLGGAQSATARADRVA